MIEDQEIKSGSDDRKRNNQVSFIENYCHIYINNNLVNTDSAQELNTISNGVISIGKSYATPEGTVDGTSDWYLNGIINCPKGILRPFLSIDFYIGIISKKKNELLFVADTNGVYDSNNLKIIVSNFLKSEHLDSTDLQNLDTGFWIDKTNFKSFDSYKASIELNCKQNYA